MYLKQKLSQSRRDFQAIYACRACGHEHRSYGYDDFFFHQKVIPSMICPSCETQGDVAPPSAPDVPEGQVL